MIQKCYRCCAVDAVIRCLDCVPLDMEFLCATCDMEAHKRNVFHDREAVFHEFLVPVPPTAAVMVDENGLSFLNKVLFRLIIHCDILLKCNSPNIVCTLYFVFVFYSFLNGSYVFSKMLTSF